MEIKEVKAIILNQLGVEISQRRTSEFWTNDRDVDGFDIAIKEYGYDGYGFSKSFFVSIEATNNDISMEVINARIIVAESLYELINKYKALLKVLKGE